MPAIKGISKSEPEYSVLPDHLHATRPGSPMIISYASSEPVIKGKSKLRLHMISLITEGEKIIHAGGKQVHVRPTHISLLATGNYLYTERFEHNRSLKSTMLFFNSDALQDIQKPAAAEQLCKDACEPFVLFPKDDFINNYIGSLQTLQRSGKGLSLQMQTLKIKELLLYLSSEYPALFFSFQGEQQAIPDEQSIRLVVQENATNNLSTGELAFLCHMSLPTFKRKFTQLYKMAPGKWMQEQRLQLAADLLMRKKARPGDIYPEAGYENHSSFSQAFKALYGVSPKDYAGGVQLSATGSK